MPARAAQTRPAGREDGGRHALPQLQRWDLVWTLTVWIQCVQATERLRRAAGEAGVLVWTIWRHLLNLPRLWSFYSDQAAAVQLYLLYAEFLVSTA